MHADFQTHLRADKDAKEIKVERNFNAPLALVWRAWTEPDLLEQWWAPRPWKAITKSLDFQPGGCWLYFMQSPEGEKHWCRVDFNEVTAKQRFSSRAAFCDEAGTVNTAFPLMYWDVHFLENNGYTSVLVTLHFDELKDLEAIVQMGFNEGFTMAHGNLDALLAALQAR